MKFILGEKLGCVQLVGDKGEIVPVTLIGAEDSVVLQLKNKENDGYDSIQIGFGFKKEKNISKPLKGHFKNLGNFSSVREFRFGDTSGYKVGDKISVSDFSVGDKATVSAVSIGKGFQGVVKRHNFAGGPASHGHRDVLRKPGSIGGRFPQRVLKGKRMAGRMGGERVTIKNLRIVRVDKDRKIIAVGGSVPGKAGSVVEIRA